MINHVPLLVGDECHGLIDDAQIPTWEYLQEKMLQLGYGKSSIPQWEGKRAKVWRALLLTWIRISKIRRSKGTMENAGGYLQTMLHSSKLGNVSFKQLAIDVILNAPKFRDSVVDTVAEYKSFDQAQKLAMTIDENKKIEKQTVDNNDLLKEMKRLGKMPKIFDER